MIVKFGQKTQESVGLDIGDYSIKVSSIKKEADRNILTSYNLKKIPPEGNRAEKLSQLIKETLDEVGVAPEDVNFSVSGSDVIVRFIDLPKMTKEQLDNSMAYEAEKYIPFNVNEVVMDSVILGRASEAGQMRVLLAAVKKDYLESRIKVVDKLGFGVNVVDIDSFAEFNAFLAAKNNLPKDKGTAFFDFGHTHTNMLISIGEAPCFMRQIQIGGADITNTIAEDLGISAKEAEELKTKSDEETKNKVSRSTFSVLDELIREMQLSFGYFENRFNEPVGSFYCSGGQTYQEGVVEYIQEKIGIKVDRWDPTAGMVLAEDLSKEAVSSIGSQLAVSIGLALRG